MQTTLDSEMLEHIARTPIVQTIEGMPCVMLPQQGGGWALQQLPELLDQPLRTQRVVTANDVTGFIDYTLHYAGADTHVYAGPEDAPKLVAIIDDHDRAEPGHAQHRCVLNCPITAEWKTWRAAAKQAMDQLEFAEFIQNNLRDIVKPSGAEMLQLATTFSDHRSADFRSSARLANGLVQFQYIESEKAGEVRFPEQMQIGVPVFAGMLDDNGAPIRYAVDARLRYRIKDAKLVMWYELDRPDLVLRTAYADLLKLVQTETDLRLFRAL